ncbi:MAG TPA: MBL fold metallo-hydrolase, partial [Bryobacteraceae bacterium]|nr:MBL fold metallo-hydrolase [Bryobacteraceae bacterium]
FVTPEGKSLLIDTGWPPGLGGPRPVPGAPPPPPMPSSADRIAAAAASFGVTKIDYLLMTHYHVDHLGGIDALLAKLPVDTFIDHGPNREEPPPNARPRQLAFATATLYPKWVAAYQGHGHVTAEAGQKLDIGSMHLEFVTSDGHVLDKPLPDAGEPDPLCAGVPKMERNGGEENVRSVGTLITFGKTRILYLGDLTWNKELELLCPTNKIGKVDLYFVTGHGMNLSSSPPTAAFDPLVAIMQNGPTKGGDEAVIKTVNTYPDLKSFWRLHYSVRYPDLNGDPDYIANLNGVPDQGNPIDIDITRAGDITVTNGRNHFSKTYQARAAQ